jgi:hypothetical protein
MYCSGDIVLSKNLTLSFVALYSYFSSIKYFYIENKPEISGFWHVAKEKYFFNSF